VWGTHTPSSQLQNKVPLIAGQPSTLQQQTHQQQQQQHQYATPQQQAHQQQAAHVTQAKPEEDDDDDFDIQLDIPQPAAQFRPEADDVSTQQCKRALYSLANSAVLHSLQYRHCNCYACHDDRQAAVLNMQQSNTRLACRSKPNAAVASSPHAWKE